MARIVTFQEPAKGRNRPAYQAAVTRVLLDYARFLDFNPTRDAAIVRVRWYSRRSGYHVAAGYRDTFTGGFVPVSSAFSKPAEG